MTVPVPDTLPLPVRVRLANDEPARVVRVPALTVRRPAPVTVSDAVPPPKSTSAPEFTVMAPTTEAPAVKRMGPGPLNAPDSAEKVS